MMLDERRSNLPTFNVSFSIWWLLQMPFGISSAQEFFQKKAHEVLEGLNSVDVIIDDILMCRATREQYCKNLTALLERCCDCYMRLNPQKKQVRVEQVRYFGYILEKGAGLSSQIQRKQNQ